MTSTIKPRFRASYTVLSMWASGRWQDAISAYFKLETYSNYAMEDGKRLHEEWREETLRTGRLPEVFGGDTLIDPILEEKRVVPLGGPFDLVFVMDAYDDGDIHEYKSGTKSSVQYSNDKQIGIYAVGALLSGLKAKRLFLHHYNQYTKKSDTTLVWVTEKLITDTIGWVDTMAREMYRYLLENGLYERFGNETNGYGSTANVEGGISLDQVDGEEASDGIRGADEGSGDEHGNREGTQVVDQSDYAEDV